MGLTLAVGAIHRAHPQFIARTDALVTADFCPRTVAATVPSMPPSLHSGGLENSMNTIRCYDRYAHLKRLAVLVGVMGGIALGLLAR